MPTREIETRFAPGEDVAFAIHRDHPEAGPPQLFRVQVVNVEEAADWIEISYWLRISCHGTAWTQGIGIGPRTRAGYVLAAEAELVPFAEAIEAYRAYTPRLTL
jgi:hypothetical protein